MMPRFRHPIAWMIAGLLIGLGIMFLLITRQRGPVSEYSTGGEPVDAEILYLSPSRAPELWRVSRDGQDARRITFTGGTVYDYAAAQVGSRIIYSARNAQQGYDLWQIDRNGKAAELLLACGADWCTSPAISPDNRQVAYSRRQASGLPGSAPGVPHLWILNQDTQQTEMLVPNPNTGGASPAWSPDGRYLAFLDDPGRMVRIIDFVAKKEYAFESGEGASIAWSPDSHRLFFTRSESTEEQPFGTIQVVDMQSGQAQMWLGEDQFDYGPPAVSPDGQWVVAARRQVNGVPGRQLWLLHADGSQPTPITDDPLSNHAYYNWDPRSEMVVLQRLGSGASGVLPEIAIWDRQANQIKILAEDAFQPEWIP